MRTKLPIVEAVTDGNGTYMYHDSWSNRDLGHGNYTVVTYPRNETYNDLKVSSSFLVESPPLPLPVIAQSLLPILTVAGIGIAALKVLPKHVNKRKQTEIVLTYLDKIDASSTKGEVEELKKEITDLILRNKVTKEQFDILEKKANNTLQNFK